jgi:hypothetical protein
MSLPEIVSGGVEGWANSSGCGTAKPSSIDPAILKVIGPSVAIVVLAILDQWVT